MSLIDHDDHARSGHDDSGHDDSGDQPAVPAQGRVATARTEAKVRRSEAEKARENAMGLLPEVPAPLPRKRRHRLVALISALAALALLVTIFGGAWELARFRDQVGSRESTSASLTTEQEDTYAEAAAAAENAPAGTGAAPVVLAYHDISPESESQYVITPQAFANQMAMLREAGYTTLTQEEFTAYAEGDFTPPPRSAVITFDDGTAGLHTYGDKILQDNGLHAISFLITGRVGTRAPYYLTWEQIQRMQKSGRWSFASHTGVLHTRAPVGEDGEEGSVLTNRQLVDGQQESYGSFTQRVRADLRRSITDFTAHDLPRPTLFAWPFSEVRTEVAAGADPRPTAFTRSLVDDLFAVSFVNDGDAPRPAVREDLEAGLVARQEIFEYDDADDVFAEMERMQQIPVGSYPANEASRTWLQPTTRPAPVDLDGAAVRFDAPAETYLRANWAPQATSTWSRYAVEAGVTGLTPEPAPALGGSTPDANSGGLRARVGQVGEVTARTSSTWVNVTRGDERVYSGPLPGGRSAAAMRLEVTPEDVTVIVDGRTLVRVPAQPGDADPVASRSVMLGSFGIVGQRGDDPEAPFPSLEDVTVTALP